ncbi:MAG TPA: aromatic ring-hydroxylating dioxygenase subunit alpha [Chloroflexota bacterium]
MLTSEENERLTQVGAGTPVGELLRRYWHVVAGAEQLNEEPVRPLRLLGEDLVLFRTETGALGLVGNRCLHRGLSLGYGIPQSNGLRCAYHGWTYDASGVVVDMPFEPACLPLKTIAYPVQELGGLIFAYLGPEPAPLLPHWDLLVKEGLRRDIKIADIDCNWMQAMDNAMDPVHFEHLHAVFGNYVLQRTGKGREMHPARHVKIDFDVFEYGIFKRRLLEGEPEECDDWTTGHPILFPNILAQGGGNVSFQFRVPVDDIHTRIYWYTAKTLPLGSPPQDVVPVGVQEHRRGDGSFVADYVAGQDMLAWVGQGPISDRSREHLATSDKGILLYRKVLEEQIAKMERGEDPMGVIRDPARNEPYITFARETKKLQAFHTRRPEEQASAPSRR